MRIGKDDIRSIETPFDAFSEQLAPGSEHGRGRFGTPVSHIEESTHMNRKSFVVGLLAAGCFVTLITPGNAQADPKVAKVMAVLKAETAKLGAPKAEGTDQTADKTTPGLYFGSTKVNNDFTIVDKVKAEAGG